MPIQTLEDLENCLDSDLGWRRKEISSVYLGLRETPRHARPAMCRASFSLLYAHFEGYTKTAATGYLEYVCIRKLNIGDLALPFMAIAVRRELEKITPSSSYIDVQATLNGLRNCDTTQMPMASPSVITTGSNLWSSRFCAILQTIGLDYSPYSSKFAYIDETLLEVRNSVSHGANREVGLVDVIEAKRIVLDILEELSIQIYLQASHSAYRRNQS